MASCRFKPRRDVMSMFTPLAAAPRLVRASGAVVAPVPPKPTAFFETEFFDKSFEDTKRQIRRRLWGVLDQMHRHPGADPADLGIRLTPRAR